MLAGLVQSPSRLAPSHNPDGAERRARVVLGDMADQKLASEDAVRVALAHPAHAVKSATTGSVNYVADWVMDAVNDVIGRFDEDIVVETSIEPPLQAAAERALAEVLAQKGEKFGVGEGALVAMTPDGVCAGAGRRQKLRRKPIQSRHRRQAAAGLGVQAFHLSHGARARPNARHRQRRTARSRCAAGSRKTTNTNIWDR